MHDPKRRLRLVVSPPPTTQREEDRRADALLQRLVLATDEADYAVAYEVFIAWAREADLKVVK